MCPADLAAYVAGYEMTHRDAWERSILHANSTGMLKHPLAYDDLFKPRASKNTIRSKEDWEAFKERFKSKGEQDG